MGWSVDQVEAVSFWQFNAACDGYRKSQGGDEDDAGLTPTEIDDIGDWLDEPPPWLQ
jgi:hypothetical protein